MRLLGILFSILFFVACGDNKDIASWTQGVVNTSIKPQIIFKNNVSDNINTILESSGEISINGAKYFGKYMFDTPNTLTLLPEIPLNANKSYKIDFDFDKINSLHSTNIKAKNFTIAFETQSLQSHVERADFIKDANDLSKIKLEAKIHLSQSLPESNLKESIQLVDSNNAKIPLIISNVNDREILITSQSLPQSNKQYVLNLDKNLGLEESQKVMILASNANDLKVISIKPIINDKLSIEVRFSAPLTQNLHLDNFIKISPEVTFRTSQSNDKIIISGDFSQNKSYNLEILKGIKASDNAQLKQNITHKIEFSDKIPQIVFSNNGVFLPDSANKKIAFKSMNVKNAKLVIKKIYANNITYFLNDHNLFKKTASQMYIYDFEKIGGIIAQKDIKIDSVKNEWVQNEIDLSPIKELSGIFIVSLHFDKNDVDYTFPANMESWRIDNYFYDNGNIFRELVFSNIALIAQKFNDNVIVSALDIKTNTPLPNIQIEGISKNNQIISKAITNEAGNATIKYSDNIKGTNDKQNIFYIVGKNSDSNFALIKLNAQEISDDGFDTDGIIGKNGVKAFIYTDRGVYRPGEVANINIIARNNNTAINHPIKLSITNPQGKKVINGKSLESLGDGVFYYGFASEKTAPTGIYNITINIGDNIFTHRLALETITPDRIKVQINAKDNINFKDEKNLTFSIQGDYLFGAPANELEWNLNAYFSPQQFKPKKYKNWSFGKVLDYSYRSSNRLQGKLDANGFVENNFSLSSFASSDANININLIAQVFENNGRAVTARKNITLTLFDSFVGIKNPQNRYIKSGESVSLEVVLLDDKENFIKNRKLAYKVYQNNYSWWWDYSNKNDFIMSIKSDKNTSIIAEGELISKDSIQKITFDTKDRGEILIEVIDTTNNQLAQVSMYASSWGEPLDVDKITQLKIKSDKNSYVANDTAKVSFESIKGGKALVTISNDNEILERYWINTNATQTDINVKIDEKNAPNLYVSVFLLQDYATLNNDRSLRLYGVVPLNITNKKAQLEVDIKAKDEILPNSTLEVEISNKQNRQVTYTLAIVDEGLLNLTSFETPSPYHYFYAKTKYNIRNYDTYDYIIGKIEGEVRNSYSIGGDEVRMQDKQKSDENANRFKPVVHFVPPTKSDKKGKAKIRFDVPSYLGNLRVMLVAVDNNSYGSGTKDIRVNAPVVMLPTIPRSLKVNDNFKIPIEVIKIKDSIKSANITIKSDGIISFDKSTQEVSFKDKKTQTIFFEGKVKEELGIENIGIQLYSDGFKMQDSTQIDIKAPNPYMQISKNWTINNDSIIIESPTSFIKNSNRGYITISSQPLLNIDHRIKWLIRYPYGCIEQTTSSVFPQLFIEKLSNASFLPNEAIVDNINAGIRRIQTFQTDDGGFSYWQGEGVSNEYGSNYATHFLIMAKRQGYEVDDIMFKKALNYLKNRSLDIYSLYLLALSGNYQLGIMNEIYENHLNNLTVTNRWLLAASYKIAGFDDIALKISNGLSVIPNESSEYYDNSYGSILRNKAMILQAKKIITNNIDADLYNEIKDELETNNWLSTQTSAYALLVMADIKDSAKTSDIIGEITLNNSKQTFNTKQDKLIFNLNSGIAKIASQKTLFVNYSWEGISLGNTNDNITNKMQLSREFVIFNEAGLEQNIDVKTLKSGDSFYIKLRLLPYGRNYIDMENIALVQNLPSGWEIENTRLNNDIVPNAVRNANDNITYTDIRDDKVMWFANVSREMIAYIKINAVTPGEYTLPAAYAEAMYDGSFSSSTDSFRVKVLAK